VAVFTLLERPYAASDENIRSKQLAIVTLPWQDYQTYEMTMLLSLGNLQGNAWSLWKHSQKN